MGTLPHEADDKKLPDASETEPVYADTLKGRRARRRDALKLIAGIWKDRTDIPADGLEYERQLRNEWERG